MVSARPLDIYWGGFLYNSCCPLELQLNFCGRCHFCFADLNKPDRKANQKTLLRTFANYQQSGTYAAWLMRENYPIVFSNHIDPFSAGNLHQSIPLIEMMCKLGLNFTLQSKLGKSVYQVLDMLSKPIVWYVSVETCDDMIAHRIAPGAPPPSERIKQIADIIERGHKVCVGINPIQPQWLPEPEKLTSQLAAIGVWGVWVQALHLSHKQLKNMSDKGKAALGQEVIQQALYPKKYPVVFDAVNRVREAAIAHGLEVYEGQQGQISNYFQPYKDLYQKRYPLMQDWVNLCHETKREGDPIYFSEFHDFFVDQLPDKIVEVTHHIHSVVHPKALGGLRVPYKSSYSDFLKLIWENKRTVYCPANVDCFAFAADWERQESGEMGWTLWLDDDEELPVMVFKPEGTSGEAYAQWNP